MGGFCNLRSDVGGEVLQPRADMRGEGFAMCEGRVLQPRANMQSIALSLR